MERSRLALRLSQEALGVLLAAEGPVDAGPEPVLEVPSRGERDEVSSRTDLRLLAAERETAERVLRDTWKDWLPDIVASFEPLHLDPPGAFQDPNTWRAAVMARFSLDVGRERAADRLFRKAALESAKLDLEQAELRARSEVRSARAAVEAAQRSLAHAREAAEHAAEMLKITEIAFRTGARTNLELVDTQRRSRDADTTVVRAEVVLRQAKLDLLVALGLFAS